jgi:hypothetical protein
MKSKTSFIVERPRVRVILFVSFLAGLFLLLFISMLPVNTLTKTIGIAQLQAKVIALREAVYWQSRVFLNPKVEVKHTVFYGYVMSIGDDGMLEVSFPNDTIFVVQKFALADLQIKNKAAVKQFFLDHRNVNIRFDLYGDMVVLHAQTVPADFLNHTPLNIQFIEKGFALPDPNPPSNIVDRAFATHYWNIVKGNANANNTFTRENL